MTLSADPNEFQEFQRWQAAARSNPEVIETAIRSILGKRAEEIRKELEAILREDIPLLLAVRNADQVREVMNIIQARIRKVEHRVRREKAAAESMEQLWKTVGAVRDRLLNIAKAFFLGAKH